MVARRFEDEEILEALEATGGNQDAAARILYGDDSAVASGTMRQRMRGLLPRVGQEQSGPEQPERFARLVELTRRGPIEFSELCNKLDLSPSKCERLLRDAETSGVRVQIAHDHVGIEASVPGADIVPVGVAPAVGQVYRCAAISDTHGGSKYAMREQLADFIEYAYEEGCRDVLHGGDMLDGCYRHGVFELTHSGLEDQALDSGETLPRKPGLRYHAITGNHETTFAEKTGMSVGRHIEAVWRDRLGRTDLTFHGDRSAYLRLGGVVVHLWHPKQGIGYALSYPLQKQIEKYGAIKPQILLVGHWHRFCHYAARGVEAIALPCFQGGGSAFGKSIGGAPAIGGLILEWRTTDQGTIRDFSVRPRRYYERETIVDVHNDMGGDVVDETVTRPVAVPTDQRWTYCSGGPNG